MLDEENSEGKFRLGKSERRSRRGGETQIQSASAVAQGAPQAIQCADRFHLQKNLGEAVEGLLAHHLAAQRKEQTQARRDEHTTVWRPKRVARPSPKLERLQHARREERLARYEQVIALRYQGLSQQAIAELV